MRPKGTHSGTSCEGSAQAGLIEKLQVLPGYSQELGLDLRRAQDRFKWFLASILFAKRISARIAAATFRQFENQGVTTPQAVIAAGWDKLVEILDAGGYVRYDFSTASNLLEAMTKLVRDYGSLEGLYDRAADSHDLEERFQGLKGVGPVAVNIFLRELRAVWPKANPPPSPLATGLARKLGLAGSALMLPGLESALVRVCLDYCKRRKCPECPIRDDCRPS
ncbi:MAG TPA: hypothetical protein G4O03_06400 [Dehalococcoidia bacterium]|nr:hypothetical protein [Dehalococcoidia bacterium]